MRIDGTHGVEPQGRADGQPTPAKPSQPSPSSDEKDSGAAAQVVSAHQAYIAKAKEVDEIDLQAVENAKKLLASGQLSSAEAIRRAAEKLLRDGV